MKNFTNLTRQREYIKAQSDFLSAFAPRCDYAITLQTQLRTYAVKDATVDERLRATQIAVTKFRFRMNRLLTGNGWLRNEKYIPLFLPAIEGANSKDKTLHIHAALGNTGHIASEEKRQLLLDGFRQIWLNTRVLTERGGLEVAADDVAVELIDKGTAQNWLGYIAKEANRGSR
jgi:hypothetical protein